MAVTDHTSYRTILKSNALVGGAQAINILCGIVRVKIVALLLGPTGMGVLGLYSVLASLLGTVAGLGIPNSGVRQIAEAVGSQDTARISRTVTVLRRVSVVSGLLGMLAAAACCRPLSWATFESGEHAAGIALLSLTLWLTTVGNAQTALLQGLRQLRELASVQALGGVLGTVLGIAVICLLRDRGIALYVVVAAAATTWASWRYARRVRFASVPLTCGETWAEAKPLMGLGSAFMVSALLAAGVAYLSRVYVQRALGGEAVGLFHATWTLSTLYVNLVLGAMGADLYPRLSAVASDHPAINRMVNEQVEMGLLLAVPGVLGTITLAPWVLSVFYSSQFATAAEIIQWQIIGIGLRVIGWPLGFVLLAKGRARLFLLTECVAHGSNLALLCLGVRWFGLPGLGISLAVLYLLYAVGMFYVCRTLTAFRWSPHAHRTFLIALPLVALTFGAVRLLPPAAGVPLGLFLVGLATLKSYRGIEALLGIDLWARLRARLQSPPR